MLEVDWEQAKGWSDPIIRYSQCEFDDFILNADIRDRPYGKLGIDPASAALHYAIEVRLCYFVFCHCFLVKNLE
jgi:hypothetical protein